MISFNLKASQHKYGVYPSYQNTKYWYNAKNRRRNKKTRKTLFDSCLWIIYNSKYLCIDNNFEFNCLNIFKKLKGYEMKDAKIFFPPALLFITSNILVDHNLYETLVN